MRVLHLIKTSIGARWALLQLRELVRLGIECHAVLPDAGGLARQYIEAGVNVHLLDLNAPLPSVTFLQCAGRLRSLVSQVGPDIVHSHFVGTTLLMRYALRSASRARVFQVPGPLHLESNLLARAEVLTAGDADHWIASCEWTQSRYRALGIAPDRVFLSHYGTDLEVVRAAAPGSLRAELGIDVDTHLVGMVAYCYKPKRYLGTRRGIKGHEDFIDAVALLRRKGSNVVGIIAGGPWTGGEAYYATVQAYAQQNRDARIIFLGTRRDIPAIYADLDVAVHPSLSENLGGAGESLLLGVPTVTTNVGGFPDLVRDGVTGLLVEPRNPSQLASAISHLLEDRIRALMMAKEGQRHAQQMLDVRKTAGQIASIYSRILDVQQKKSTVEARIPVRSLA